MFHAGRILKSIRTPLVVEWLRIHLPVQGTQVQSLVQEDSTCHGPTRPVGHKYCSPHTPEPVLHNTAFAMRSPRTTTESAACLPPLERKPVGSDKYPVQPKINKQIN